ncbi:cell wall metabolism sensor histidine kinase WalK [Cohnella sp. GbtcB17]|uniref:sensor histidine kinase n=1 Tax=Cohnella sp. GbtcB17 TaxID=2824762 RepID=UPI001C305AC2|nr:HAMP domain-containing sensor histidine kinase [Cohnella sp. GbtcB17]
MPAYIPIFVILLAVISLLGYRQWRMKRQLALMTARVEEIRAGAINQRVRLPNSSSVLVALGGSINRLIDDLQQNMEKLNLLESERKKMITHLSHDLCTPLTAIMGYVEVMQRDRTLTEDIRQQYFRIIAAKGNKLDALVRDFFELSKLEADDDAPEPEKLNIIEKMQESVLSFYQQFQLAGLTPQLEFPERHVYVWGNRQSIERIMNNLLSNALRYGANGETIGIRVREAEARVWVDVWDCGQGISETDLPHVFERLYTGKASRNTSQQGNGLGLTIVKKLVEKQRGEIQASSIPNERTEFSFYLPRAT